MGLDQRLQSVEQDGSKFLPRDCTFRKDKSFHLAGTSSVLQYKTEGEVEIDDVHYLLLEYLRICREEDTYINEDVVGLLIYAINLDLPVLYTWDS